MMARLPSAEAAWSQWEWTVPKHKESTGGGGGAVVNGCPDVRIRKASLQTNGRRGKLVTQLVSHGPRTLHDMRLRINFDPRAHLDIVHTSTTFSHKKLGIVLQGPAIYLIGLKLPPKKRKKVVVEVRVPCIASC